VSAQAARGGRPPGRARRRPLVEPLVGVLEKRGRMLVAEPLFEPRRGRVAVEQRGAVRAGPGDLVLVGGMGKRGARVARRLGSPSVARDVLEGLMLEHGLRRVFPRVVEEEARDAAFKPGWEGARKDLRDLATFTIDPVTARDYDDAVSAADAPDEGDGAITVWVHIADVSAYVRLGTPLDRETYRRSTSVYVPGAVEPMLPEALSSDACSLVPGEDRLAVSVEMVVRGAEVLRAAFHRSVIRSDARLTYEQVDRVFAGHESAEEPWGAPLAAARAVAGAFRERRERRSALDVSSAEPVFEFDDAGHVTGVRFEEQTESHQVIEHLMILANEQVAGFLADRKVPTLYRVHERPQPEAILRLADQLASLDVPTPPIAERMSPQEAADAAGEVSRYVAEHLRRTGGRGRGALSSLVLRSLRQAYYSPRNVGHAGLQSPRYCHFTSPIRRYPDLVAHRALLGALGLDDAAPRAGELDDAGVHCSTAEREAMKIERSADDVCHAFLLERLLSEIGGPHGDGPEFEGEVVGVIGAGAFVRFAGQGFEGFLPVRMLRGEWWSLNEEGTMLEGERSGRRIRLGDPVRVTVGRIDAPRGRVDLLPAADLA
jgi:ribonuclease R